MFDHERLDVHRLAFDYVAFSYRIAKDLKRIVSMLTRLIQRAEMISEQPIEYEYENRSAEYEYEKDS